MIKTFLTYQMDTEPKSQWIIATPSVTAKNSYAHVQEVGRFIANKNYFTERENLPSFFIGFTAAGEGCFNYNNHRYILSADELIWVDCMNHQIYHTSPSVGYWDLVWVHFYGTTCPAYYSEFLKVTGGSNVCSLPPDSSVQETINSLISLYNKGKTFISTDIHASALLTNLMSDIILSAMKYKRESKAPYFILDAQKYLSDNLCQKTSLDYFAERYSVNKYYFQKVFKKYTGHTPTEYAILARISTAKEYLRTTNYSIQQISETVGISTPCHFTNLFKKYEGMTPSTFRSRWHEKNKT